jgi:anti-anti-sigma factor
LEAELKQRIATAETRLIVDFEAVRYIGSNGLRVLLIAQKQAQQQGGSIKLCCLPPRLKEIFVMAGFDQVFEIFDTRAQAEKAFE